MVPDILVRFVCSSQMIVCYWCLTLLATFIVVTIRMVLSNRNWLQTAWNPTNVWYLRLVQTSATWGVNRKMKMEVKFNIYHLWLVLGSILLTQILTIDTVYLTCIGEVWDTSFIYAFTDDTVVFCAIWYIRLIALQKCYFDCLSENRV